MITYAVFCWTLVFFLALTGVSAIVLWNITSGDRYDGTDKVINLLIFATCLIVTGIWVSIGIIHGVPNCA